MFRCRGDFGKVVEIKIATTKNKKNKTERKKNTKQSTI